MSKIVFVKCSDKKCKYGKTYPVAVGQEEMLSKCPQCDPKSHKAVKHALQQAKMISNKAKRQGSLDAGKVQSLDAGAKALKAAGVDLTDNEDGLGVEVESTPETSKQIALPVGLSVPNISKVKARAQAKGKK